MSDEARDARPHLRRTRPATIHTPSRALLDLLPRWLRARPGVGAPPPPSTTTSPPWPGFATATRPAAWAGWRCRRSSPVPATTRWSGTPDIAERADILGVWLRHPSKSIRYRPSGCSHPRDADPARNDRRRPPRCREREAAARTHCPAERKREVRLRCRGEGVGRRPVVPLRPTHSPQVRSRRIRHPARIIDVDRPARQKARNSQR